MLPQQTANQTEVLSSVIAQAVDHLSLAQCSDGAWHECFDTGVMADAQTVIALALLGISDADWTNPLLTRIEQQQRVDGSWSVYPGAGGDLSTTVESYYALALHHRFEARPQAQSAARNFILRQGGLKPVRNLTKMFLAVGGEIPWSWLPSPRLYSWLFAKWSPVHVKDLVTFTRIHVSPMLILSALRYVSPLAKEGPFLRDLLRKQDEQEHVPRDNAAILPSGLPHWLRKRLTLAMNMLSEEREADGTLAGYHSSTFLLLFILQALGYDKKSPQFAVPLQALHSNLYRFSNPERAHQQTCNSHVWNTALAVNTLQSTRMAPHSLTLRKGIHYLQSKQHNSANRLLHSGCWGFSNDNTSHPDLDDTVAALKALHVPGREHESRWQQGAQWVLSMQNRDGGWAAFERNCHKQWLEWLPANDMRRAMSDPSTADITGTVLEFLLRYGVVPADDERVIRAIEWLCDHQEKDGSWFGRWGITYIYGTWSAIRGLTAAPSSCHQSHLKRAKLWLLSIQRSDGSFGESCDSDLQGAYTALGQGVPTQTAWGLDALVHLLEAEEGSDDHRQLLRAADLASRWLLESGADGRWSDSIPTGSAFPGALHIWYHIYPKVWPLTALVHYRDFLMKSEGR